MNCKKPWRLVVVIKHEPDSWAAQCFVASEDLTGRWGVASPASDSWHKHARGAGSRCDGVTNVR